MLPSEKRAPSGPGARPRVVARLREAVISHLGSHDVARVIYGSIIGLALVVALGQHPPTIAQTAAAIVATALAVALAEVYSEYVGTEARERRHLRHAEVRVLAEDALAVAFGVMQGFAAREFLTYSFFFPRGYGVGLPGTYAVWLVVVATLYPLCKWVAEVKGRRRDWWLSYL